MALNKYFGENEWTSLEVGSVLHDSEPFLRVHKELIEYNSKPIELTLIRFNKPLNPERPDKAKPEPNEPTVFSKADITRFKTDMANHHNLPYEAITININWEV